MNYVPGQRGRRFRLSLPALMVAIASGSVQAGEKLDMSFIQGGSRMDPAVWAALNSTYAPGRYLVDLSLNGQDLGKQVLDITPQDSEALCLPDAWLAKAGVNIRADFFKDGYDAARQCHVLTKGQSARVDFDMSTQSLALTLPQQGLAARAENVTWDYGTSALRVNYNLNASKGQNNNTGFGSADLKANVGHWVVSSTASGSTGDGGNSASIAMFTASRAIQALNADLVLGKTQVGDGLLGSTGTYGATLTHNNSMRPGELGYRPVFSGIANGYARVTLTQGKNTLYSEMVPPGPFSVTDVAVYGSGDVTMTVTEADGRVHSQIFPLSVMAGQLSPGQHEYSVSAGRADEDSDLDGELVSASYGYGLGDLTLRAGGVLHQQYQGVNGGVVTGLGQLGSVSAEGAWAVRKYAHQSPQSGSKMQLAWNKQLETTGTGLRVSWARTMTEEFPSLSGFDPTEIWLKDRKVRNTRDEWNAGISQGFGGLFSLSVSGWQRSYYHDTGLERGLTGTLSTQLKEVSLNLGASGSQDTRGEQQWAVSASVSVPFTLFERRYSSNTTMSTAKGSGVGVSTGVSGDLTDRLSWGVSGGRDSDGGMSSALNMNYTGNRATLGGNLNQSDSGGTSGSLSLSGSVLAVPAARSVMFSQTTSDTVAVVGVKDTPGVRVTSGDGQTDSDGNLVVPLNSYDSNTVTIDAGSLPLDTELSNTSQRVVPSNQAVVWMPFDAVKVHRYLLQVRQTDGTFIPGGTWARDQKGTPLGFVAANGVLMLNVMDIPGNITLGGCTIPAGKLKETEKLQEIRCEKP
ncbi:TPA: PefC/AfrB family outer membrane usher protein [Salmonella enterica subsp. enterica serovar Kintambo]|nr:outer membrane usher protein PefC [Salmonella enterica subsp. enterica serovar Kintambo]EIJ8715629.1 PefC/AfrB family outer membrane usher protein [Salmonella enterica]HCI4751685.1 PefC/AfrB family outer membrane usher protein [Salmonella enterica subsp. enterica serovar Kintambo]